MTFLMISEFLNLSFTRREGNDPRRLLTASLRLVYGDKSRRALGLEMEAKWHAGPEPIDLPNKMISLGSNLREWTTKSKTS